MKLLTKALRRILPTRDASRPIEERLFEITLCLTILTLLLWSSVGIFSQFNPTVLGIYLFALCFYSAVYFAVKKGISFRLTTSVYYISALLIISFGWLPSGGIRGAVMHMCVLIYISGLLVLPIRRYISFIISTICMVIIFVTIEYYHRDLAVPYTDYVNEWRDLSIAGVVMLVVMGFAFYIFKKEYLHDRAHLQQMNLELGAAKERAESADKAKSQFLATISHEMRTPLNGIVGLAELIEKTNLDKEQSELVKNLSTSSQILSGLITDVLDITMIENNRVTLQEDTFELKDVTKDISQLFYGFESVKTGKVSIDLVHASKSDIHLMGDLKRIRQILINLATNAVKFTPAGKVTIATTVVRKEDKTAIVLFKVDDTGIGIPKNQHPKVFSRFFKNETDLAVGGTGLGLSIAKSLTDLMHGKIWFYSTEGKGSSFYVELPLPLATHGEHSPAEKHIQPINFSELSVLVAEDVHINRLVMLKILKNIGITKIEVAEDGEQAVALASSQGFDFILMDVLMPRMDGIEATREIRRILLERKQSAPFIVAVTANATTEDENKCKEAGMVDFITKPFTTDILRAVFTRLWASA
ncbi:ATP-binding protein [Imperialibacter roseus]|uniref:histidine kinase n=1 Tax=Imperialibacter roseus TaxID=1324217 RepID=A0ABZ0IY97_9BACT|nr:ATP-binding protein [Imperialibacter roseus]WOK09611.1 ATP-binding protein [Imperialibacter roseus]